MRKASVLVTMTAGMTTLFFADGANAGCRECAVPGAAVTGGTILANSAYAHGYGAGFYAPYRGPAGYSVPQPAPVYGYNYPPFHDYGPIYYRSPGELKRLRSVRPVRRLGAPRLYAQPYYGGFYFY
jgi:hypothetical protein